MEVPTSSVFPKKFLEPILWNDILNYHIITLVETAFKIEELNVKKITWKHYNNIKT